MGQSAAKPPEAEGSTTSLCGADTWTEICEFGEAKKTWLSSFLKLPNGIPSHDTFGRVFSLLAPEAFEVCFLNWARSLTPSTAQETQEVIAVDGKTLRGSLDKRQQKKALHLVSAWATQQGLMLGQVKTEEKSNEIEAIPRLLNMIDITGSIMTVDAMGCQKDITKCVVQKGANYVMTLKDNQPTLANDVAAIFKQGEAIQFKKMLNRRKVEKVRDHGRVETRRYTLVSARDPLLFELRWPGLKSIGRLEVTRTVNHEVTRSTRYFLTSLTYDQIDDFARAVRAHWDIEINLHWSLDVSFREDLNRSRIGHSAENLAIVRRIALNLLKQEKTHQRGISCKRKRAGWDNDYLWKVLTADKNLKNQLNN